jgi:hypothetical protein
MLPTTKPSIATATAVQAAGVLPWPAAIVVLLRRPFCSLVRVLCAIQWEV